MIFASHFIVLNAGFGLAKTERFKFLSCPLQPRYFMVDSVNRQAETEEGLKEMSALTTNNKNREI